MSVVSPAKRFPLALLDKLKLELERMRRLDIVEPVSEPTWGESFDNSWKTEK